MREYAQMVIGQNNRIICVLPCQYQTDMRVGVDMDNYYPRLRDLREDHDLTQQQVADYLGMKQPQYSRYERGVRDVPTDVLIRLAKLYKTTTDYILGIGAKNDKKK